MAILLYFVAVLSFLGVVGALPSPISPRGNNNVLMPNGYFMLQEADPDTVTEVTDYEFKVSQSAGSYGMADNRTYMLITYAPTPAGSNTCALNWELQNTPTINYPYNPNQIDVKQTNGPCQGPTWNNIVAASTFPGGLTGTVNAEAGDTVVNTVTCLTTDYSSCGLAFVFKLSQSVEQANVNAETDFTMDCGADSTTNAFLTYNS